MFQKRLSGKCQIKYSDIFSLNKQIQLFFGNVVMRKHTCIILLSILTFVINGCASKNKYQQLVEAESSLISHYTFDNGTAGDSFSDNDGKIIGNDVSFAPSIKNFGNAITVSNRDGFVEFGYVPEFAFKDGSGTIEVLLRHSGVKAVHDSNYIFAQRQSWGQNSMRYGICYPGLTQLTINSYGEKTDVAFTQTPLEADVWHHFAVVFDEGVLKTAYINGQPLKLQGAVSLPDSADQHTFHLGASSAQVDTECWDGSFDELAIYADALSAETISKHAKFTNLQKD